MGGLSREDFDDAKKDWHKQDQIRIKTLMIKTRYLQAQYDELPLDADPEDREDLYQEIESLKVQIRMIKGGLR